MSKLRRTVAAACVAAVAALNASCAWCADQVETRVIYPASATSPEPQTLDVRRTARPPVREEEEFDCETPIGQIRDVLTSLQAIRADQAQTRASVDALLARSNETTTTPVESEDERDDVSYDDPCDEALAPTCVCDCRRAIYWEALLTGLICAACSVATYAFISKK